MNKIKKIVSVLVLLAMASSSAIFAQQRIGQNNPPMQNGQNSAARPQNFDGHRFCGRRNENSEIIVGKIKDVDLKNGIVTILNADSKEIKVLTGPFTNVFRKDLADCIPWQNNQQRNPPEFIKLKDLKKDEWVFVSAFDTDTDNVVAFNIKVFKGVRPTPTQNSMNDAK